MNLLKLRAWTTLFFYVIIFTEPESVRHLVVGGDVGNTNLWMSDSEGKVWRKSVKLPYGIGKTSFGATLVNKEEKVRIALCYEKSNI